METSLRAKSTHDIAVRRQRKLQHVRPRITDLNGFLDLELIEVPSTLNRVLSKKLLKFSPFQLGHVSGTLFNQRRVGSRRLESRSGDLLYLCRAEFYKRFLVEP